MSNDVPGFSNSGGVMRYTVSSDTAAQAVQREAAQVREAEQAAPKWTPSATSVGAVVRTVISNGQHTEEAGGGFSRASTSDLTPAGDGPVFKSPMGRILTADEVTPNS